MSIRNVHDLEKLERRIKAEMCRYDVDDILLGLRSIPTMAQDKLQPFMVAGAALFTLGLIPRQLAAALFYNE